MRRSRSKRPKGEPTHLCWLFIPWATPNFFWPTPSPSSTTTSYHLILSNRLQRPLMISGTSSYGLSRSLFSLTTLICRERTTTSSLTLQGHFSPSSGSSAPSPSQAFAPFTPAPPGASPTRLDPSALSAVDSFGSLDSSAGEPTLPYLNPDILHGTNYVDFRPLFSWIELLDEEPRSFQKTRTTSAHLQSSDLSVLPLMAVRRVARLTALPLPRHHKM